MYCDFCKSPYLTEVYLVPTSKIGAVIYSCDSCGLLQSKYSDKTNKHKHQSISSDADWGNVRHGKKIRLETSLKVIKKFVDFNGIENIMDIGSNRGHFVNYIIENYKKCKITAIEPDSNILNDYIKDDRIKIINNRFEHFNSKEKFDFIYCCHTLEHADSASNMLTNIKRRLNNDGYFYLDVPDYEILLDEPGVEEFFIDKHTFHFSYNVLKNYLTYLGFEILYESNDGYNLVFLCKNINHSEYNKSIINQYKENIQENRNKLVDVANKIEELAKKENVALIGASKIYDALIKYGKLDLTNIKYVADDYLYGYLEEAHGKKIYDSSVVNKEEIDTVVLLARSAMPGLIKRMRNKGIKNIIPFNKLL